MTANRTADRFGVEVIGVDECLALLASHEVGRLAVVHGGAPQIFPVNYAVADGMVVFRTAPGTKLTAALRGPVVFEVDEIDAPRRRGWSVVVHGRAEDITGFDSYAVRELTLLPLHPWTGEKPLWVRVIPTTITGRRLV